MEKDTAMRKTDDLRITEIKELTLPAELMAELEMSTKASDCVCASREAIRNILSRKDNRLVVIVGPCSIHDLESAHEYAERLRYCIEQYKSSLHIVMRVYFEKPRTIAGWKGLINDPDLDDSFKINKGLKMARQLLLDLNEMGVSAGTEYLDLISPQFVSDLISWGAIGARTTESQVHRELASGLSCPVGFKNGTSGDLQIAVDALRSAALPHHFLSVTKQGRSAIFSTSGNPDCHIIMRGGKQSNYDAASVKQCSEMLSKVEKQPNVMIDFSHANSAKQHERQLLVGESVAEQLRGGEESIIGIMIESHLVGGRQNLVPKEKLVYGQSITDACLSWEDTEKLLALLAESVDVRRDRAR